MSELEPDISDGSPAAWKSVVADQAKQIATLTSQVSALVEAMTELVQSAKVEANEKGAGGYHLARISDGERIIREIGGNH